MASRPYPALKSGVTNLYSDRLHFHRGESVKKNRRRRRRKKVTLNYIHIVISFIAFVVFFYSIQQLSLYLLSWDYLNIKEVIISSSSEKVKKQVKELLAVRHLPNILLVDSSSLQKAILSYNWVEEARIRKIFPDTLKIEIKERKPVAVLKKKNYYLIDKAGIPLEIYSSPSDSKLPLLIDSNDFQKNSEEKIKLAWECLKNTSPALRDTIKVMDLSYLRWTTLHLRNTETRVKLRYENFAQGLQFFMNKYKYWEKQLGPLEYVDLRFQGRIYAKPQQSQKKSVTLNSNKEAL